MWQLGKVPAEPLEDARPPVRCGVLPVAGAVVGEEGVASVGVRLELKDLVVLDQLLAQAFHLLLGWTLILISEETQQGALKAGDHVNGLAK